MDEFGIIQKYFTPLAQGYKGALGLKDDAAIYTPTIGKELILTKDAITEGTHFFGNETPEQIAHKLVAINVSDLAAMGATPKAYLIAMILPKSTDEQWIAGFAEGLRSATEKFGGYIIGGDTVAHDGKMSFSLTAIGEVPNGKALKKSGARQGDKIYVSGTIGDSYLGLQILSKKLDIKSSYLQNRYLMPEPKIKLGIKLLDIASSCTDISDGLVADLKHICGTSGVGAVINTDNIPLSEDAVKSGVNIEKLITGGDDYELIFTIPSEVKAPKGCFYIGDITKNKDVLFLDSNSRPIKPTKEGYNHFS
ncbi:MAG: thiamine-phosphate kinase [Rickettsiales bacterium]|nr:thiamine-phosphate kinase [Pseudomonadota bacterium]MDA0965995.1 thiamine-phosphate kinase [Pseudomonadota bacterium]MDG4542534.1 thiamine-phosphate kinase [Rickettsiales bacterium]MDG4545038.1 thiamine-phosphate kinase [Rickettsiales bacterium]MDG4547161.1 thiamine-phosphate kinase [Rickettsiales bacterium]